MTPRKRIAIYPGTFDPVTNGHLDILGRASEIFDKVIVAVVKKPSKRKAMFPLNERLGFLRESIKGRVFGCPVEIEGFDGLLVNYARRKKAQTLVRGLRAISDFEYEFQMALMNRHQAPRLETVFLMPDERFVYLSSSIVKTVGALRGNLSAFLPPPVLKSFKRRFF